MDSMSVELIGSIIEAESIDVQSVDGETSYGIKMINAERMWSMGIKGKGIKIAVIDTGCDINHKSLKGRIVEGRNFTSEDNGDYGKYTDYNGHGTHVAGIIAANSEGEKIVGVAPEADLIIKLKNAARFTNSNKEVDVTAPGVAIISTYLNNRYASFSGTSMAAPFVSGAMALIIQWSTMEFGRRLTEAELYGQLIKITTDLNIPRTMQGNGIVDFSNIIFSK